MNVNDLDLAARLRHYADRDDHEWGVTPVSRTMREAADLIEKYRLVLTRLGHVIEHP